MKTTWQLLKDIVVAWNEDKAPRLAAGLAFYTMFTLSPLLIIVIASAGLVFGQEAARGQIVGQIQGLVGAESAHAIEDFLKQVSAPRSGIIATAIGLATLLLGVWWVFGELQDALNTIWEVAPKPGRKLAAVLKARLISFAMMLGVGFLLLVSLALSAALSALGAYVLGLFPDFKAALQLVNVLGSFGVITLLFAMIYKIVPDVVITWGDVWIGAAATALLYTIGKYLIGVYLGTSSTASAYGAAGSLVVILIWVYYSAQILFLGAEFTKVYAQRYGSRIVPTEIAVPVTEEARAQQGLPAPATVIAAEAIASAHPPHRSYDRYAAAVCGFIAGIVVTGLFSLHPRYPGFAPQRRAS
ncbi:MAG TPA: YihY/virulence factor BrkB family protein, partial [Roseiflexaceae bacterium]|nr:YihY/virulence factor BrkB family protein [Roseiflexaceae bacterium]